MYSKFFDSLGKQGRICTVKSNRDENGERIYTVETKNDNSHFCELTAEEQKKALTWIQYNLILYLQRRNPSVPGIANKIYPPEERKLEKVKKYWKLIVAVKPTLDIYSGIMLSPDNISIDHFVPWSYVAHDELWNLHPTTRDINSSKSNHLPDWGQYFDRLGVTEYEAYELVQSNEAVQKEFDKCVKEHVNSSDILEKLYRPGIEKQEFIGTLKTIVEPVYKAASDMGFDFWRYNG